MTSQYSPQTLQNGYLPKLLQISYYLAKLYGYFAKSKLKKNIISNNITRWLNLSNNVNTVIFKQVRLHKIVIFQIKQGFEQKNKIKIKLNVNSVHFILKSFIDTQ